MIDYGGCGEFPELSISTPILMTRRRHASTRGLSGKCPPFGYFATGGTGEQKQTIISQDTLSAMRTWFSRFR